jgi:hypothetical protein
MAQQEATKTYFLMRKQLVFTGLLLLVIVVQAQTQLTTHILGKDSANVLQPATIHDFEIITGYWAGNGMGGKCEEAWFPPVDNRMHGVFRYAKENNLIFTEFMSILQDSSGWVLKMKHFTPDLVGWEEKDRSVEFRFIKRETNTLYFSGLTFVKEDENTLTIYLAFKQKDNTYSEEVFSFSRTGL